MATGLRSAELAGVTEAIDAMTLGVGKSSRRAAPPRFQRILVALDGSPGSSHALAWAAALANGLGSQVTLVSVAPPSSLLNRYAKADPGFADVAGMFNEFEREARNVLDKGAAMLLQAGVKARARLEEGPPVARIRAVAKAVNADLLILGSHGHGALDRALLGSVTEGVKNQVAASVLIARGPPASPILAATDGSPASKRAVFGAFALGRTLDHEVKVLHVLDLPAFGRSRPGPDPSDRRVRSIQAQVAEASHDPRLHYEVAAGNASRVIVQSAEAAGAGLLVVGSRGLGSARGALLGSVSNRVSHTAKGSVLIVKGA